MTEIKTELYEPKYKRLRQISKMATFISWTAVVIFGLQAFSKITVITNYMSAQPIEAISFPEYWQYLFWHSISVIEYLLRGLVYWLVLKGISVGLNMILETDQNYRKKLQVVEYE